MPSGGDVGFDALGEGPSEKTLIGVAFLWIRIAYFQPVEPSRERRPIHSIAYDVYSPHIGEDAEEVGVIGGRVERHLSTVADPSRHRRT